MSEKKRFIGIEYSEDGRCYFTDDRISLSDNAVLIDLGILTSALRLLSSNKTKVLAFLLDNKDDYNMVNVSMKDVEEIIGISKATIFATLEILQKEGMIKRNNGAIMFSPVFVKSAMLPDDIDLNDTYLRFDLHGDNNNG